MRAFVVYRIDQLIAMSVGTNTLTCAVNFLALMLFAFHKYVTRSQFIDPAEPLH